LQFSRYIGQKKRYITNCLFPGVCAQVFTGAFGYFTTHVTIVVGFVFSPGPFTVPVDEEVEAQHMKFIQATPRK
jgi:hypothetical protein